MSAQEARLNGPQGHDVPFGYCHCGCGEKTAISNQSKRRGLPNFYVWGHTRRTKGVPSCGYTVDPETGCWVWGRPLDRYGYGHANGTTAHCFVWEQVRGAVPDGLELDHLCRNRACVNPDHLEPVTHEVNTRRGRTAKVTPEQVAAIRADPRPGREIAKDYPIEQPAVAAIKRGATWQ